MADGQPARDRPKMPAGYGVDPAVQSDLLAWEAVVQQLEAAHNYWVCTTRRDGRPHAAPVWGLWMESAFFFSTDPASQKGRNLTERPEVVVHLESGDDAVILEGQAERVTDIETLTRMVDAYDKKYAIRFDPTDPNMGIYTVRPRLAYAWAEKNFPTSATRWRFKAD